MQFNLEAGLGLKNPNFRVPTTPPPFSTELGDLFDSLAL